MNITEINKVANRKRLTANADKLREKIAREHKNVIKLRVAQDTAYWDVKERLRQVESAHERLQANMVEVQMQHEAISGQYQDELRQRPETVNKLTSTRSICDVLEEYSERLRSSLARCRSDHAALAAATRQGGERVRDLHSQVVQADVKAKENVQGVVEKLKLSSEHNNQLLQCLGSERQRADAALADARARLEAADVAKERLQQTAHERERQLDLCKADLEKKEETIANLQNDIKHLIQEFNSQGAEIKNTLNKQEKDLKETSAANESLKQALTNQEAFTKTVCDQNSLLQEKIAALEEEQVLAKQAAVELQQQVEVSTKLNTKFEEEVASMIQMNESLQKAITDKNQLLTNAEQEIQDLKLQLSTLESEKASIASELKNAREDIAAMTAKVLELTGAGQELETKILEIELTLQECRETADTKIFEMTSTIQSKERDLDAKASTIAQLMSQVKAEGDARIALEDHMQQMKKETELERQDTCERERAMQRQMEQLENVVRNKESELSSQMNIILELRSDKDRLQAKIESMQNKIDNIQKELSGPPLPRPPPADQDDNAVMLTPDRSAKPDGPAGPKLDMPVMPSKEYFQKQPQPLSGAFAATRRERERLDGLALNFLSDSSMDGDNSMDPNEVNRRFEALSRGERVSPMPAKRPRRRSAVPIPPGGLRIKTREQETDSAPLAQLKEDILKAKEKAFFKNKRQEKMKKPKPVPY